MIEPVIEGLARDCDGETGHVAEIRQADAARRMGLVEDGLVCFAVDGTPGPDVPLQCSADAAAQFGMPPQHLLKNGDRTGAGPQQGDDLRVENIRKRIGTSPTPQRLLLRRLSCWSV
ncbi:hypothetical protein JF546_05365 [Nitratireductor aquimarinus]|nr:hypothetical protein [Nitratireductor aquimarinus]MBY6130818.1 hypothetical protein [Nitratireductor aquimarinus]